MTGGPMTGLRAAIFGASCGIGAALGQLFSPDHGAAQILAVIDRLSVADSGGLFARNEEQIAY